MALPMVSTAMCPDSRLARRLAAIKQVRSTEHPTTLVTLAARTHTVILVRDLPTERPLVTE